MSCFLCVTQRFLHVTLTQLAIAWLENQLQHREQCEQHLQWLHVCPSLIIPDINYGFAHL